ncbi:MAG: hypothetical protein VW268_08810 [Rhodospirillaceae bacterium]
MAFRSFFRPVPRLRVLVGMAARLAVIAVVFMASASAVRADPAKGFHEQAQAAFSHYRQAVFYARRGAPDVALLELDNFIDAWSEVAKRFEGAPPPPYAGEKAWRDTFGDIARRAGEARKLAEAGDAKAVGAALAPLRTMLSQMRRRNGIYLFADCILDANKAFRDLYKFRHDPPKFTNEAETKALQTALAGSIKAYEKCRDTAPAEVAADAQFSRLIADSLHFLDRMKIAIKEKNQLNVINILRRVVSSDDILWLRFG